MNPLATEFFHALQSLILDGDPKPTAARKPERWCRWCREDGTCMHCEIPEQHLTPEQKRTEAEMLQAVADGRLPRW